MATTTDKLVEQLGAMTVLELVELKKRLEEEWGVTAAGDKKIQVIKVVRALTGLGLKEAKDLVDAAPKAVKEAVTQEEAESVKAQLEEAGATVELK